MSKVQVQPASDLHEHYLCWPNTFRRPTDDEWYNEVRSLKDKVSEWKTLSVTAVAAENHGVAEYIKQLENRLAEAIAKQANPSL